MAVLPLALVVVSMASAAHAQANIINTIAGGGPTPTDPLQADIPGPTGVIKLPSGDLLIAPPFSSYVYKLSSGGIFSVYSGKGYGGFGGDGGPVGQAQLGYPSGFAVDSKGNLYLTDFGNSRVRKVDAATGKIATIAGNGQKCAHPTNPCGDGGAATAALLNLPEAVAVDAAFNVYIADSADNRIRKVDGTTGVITTIAGTGDPCTNPTNACGDGGPAKQAQLNFPQGVAVDAAGVVYISDTGDNRVRKIDNSGNITRYAGNGGACLDSTKPCGDGNLAVNANLHAPQGIALDASGNGYIADSKDNRIRKVDASTQNISTFAGSGVQGFSGDGGPATAAKLDLPGFVFPESSGAIDIADTGNQRIRQVSSGVIQTIAGGGSGGDGGPAKNATLAGPYTLTEDSAGNVYFTDLYNNRVRKIANDASRTITTVAGTGSAGYSGDGGPATSAMLNGPSSVALDGQGHLYIADENNLVVRKLDLNSGVISLFAGTPGQSCFPTTSSCGDNGSALSATFASPQTVALDTSGNVYIADYFAHRVRRVDAVTGIVTTAAGTGTAGNKGDGGPATSANLNHPSGIVLDSANVLYISDQYNNRIRVVKTDNNIYAFALNGLAHLGGDGGPAINGSMWNPLEITMDPVGNWFVSGGNNRVVQIIDAATQYWGTVAGSSTKSSVGGFSGDGGPAQSARLANAGSSVDAQGNLYIADEGNNRVRYVLLAPAISNTPPSLAFGNVPLNTTSAPQTITTLSSGGLDLNLTLVQPTDSHFTLTNNCPQATPLAPNRKCTMSVTFTPTAYGKQTGSLVFTDNAGNSPQSVSLSGSGPDFTIAASPTSITVNKGSSGTSTITLAPLGQFSQGIKMSCSGAPAGASCGVTPTTVPMDGVNNGTATLTVTIGASTPSGVYPITVKGAFVPLQHPVTVNVTVP